ncbi:hypothetical protein BJ878DRAFT_561629 [Calycina marina]|uniref:Uncharacterized protein n=1 Tax=Calycina marina TaxID=1763456 RepID=A0A9P8CI58_9HELO|nr:hypothetical protein BJ878DRAFT_561629 [Calycina marina]
MKSKSPAGEDWQALEPEVKKDSKSFLKLSFDSLPDTDEVVFVGSTWSGHILDDQNSVEELGRTYHGYKEGSFFWPNDRVEQGRLDLQHTRFRLPLDGRLAPVPDPAHVLDLATGTEIWYPRMFEHNFDYIHARAITTCFQDTTAVFKQAFDNLNEGEYIEIEDMTGAMLSNEDTAMQLFTQLMHFSSQSQPYCGSHMFVYLRIGLASLRRDVFRCLSRLPATINTWPSDPKLKEIGRYAVRAIGLKALPAAGLSHYACAKLIFQAQKDIGNHRIHSYSP